MIKDVIQSVVNKMRVFETLSIGTSYNAGVFLNLNAVALNLSYGDISGDFTGTDTIILNGGSCDGQVVVASAVHFFPANGTVFDVSLDPTTCNDYTSVSITTDKIVDGIGEVTINASDVQYWHIGARMGFLDGGTYYYGAVTAINSNVLTVLLDNLDNLSSITEFIMDINYRHGHPVDVFDQLQRMARNKNYKLRRFPVIALMQDFDEDLGAMDETPIQIILAVMTLAQYTASERYTNSFDGLRLTKLYERFLQYLEWDTSTYFRRSDAHKIDRLYWGKEGALGNEDNKAYDLIDAIELKIDLKTLNTC